jgi:tyrosinase
MGVRKNQKDLTKGEWQALIAAIDAMHGTAAAPPAYRQFVSLHVKAMSMAHMDWHVHTMQMGGTLSRGTYFLPWHRRFLKLFEERLQKVNPAVTIPYWDSITERKIPAALDDAALLTKWSVSREWHPERLADPSDLDAVKKFPGTFSGFQTLLEGAVHADTHNAVGGDMSGSASPTDPLFWLHHAFLDKVWADWQASPHGKAPAHTSTVLKPANMQTGVPFGVTIASVLNIADLGYSYT